LHDFRRNLLKTQFMVLQVFDLTSVRRCACKFNTRV